MSELAPPIPSYRVNFDPELIEQVCRSIRDILGRGQLTLGPYTEELERSFAALVGTRFAVAVSSGTAALEIALRAMNVRGRSVLVPANTNFATAIAAMNAGADVILYDSDLYPSLEDIERQTRKDTAVVIVVHIGGYIAPWMDGIRTWCRANNITLVEDAAHAHGARLGRRGAGSLGDAAAFSFFPTKVMTTGEGGMITTDDPLLTSLARSYRNQGKDEHDGTHQLLGNSWRMPEVSAALGLAQLKSFERHLAERVRTLSHYYAALDGFSQVMAPQQARDATPSGHKCIVLAADAGTRRKVEDRMAAANIELPGTVYTYPLHRLPVFRGRLEGSYPRAADFAERHFCLPLWNGIDEASIRRVINVLRSFTDLSAPEPVS